MCSALLWNLLGAAHDTAHFRHLRRLAQQSTQNLQPGPPSSTKEAHFHGNPSRCFRTAALEKVEKAVADQSRVLAVSVKIPTTTNCDRKAAIMPVEHHTSLDHHLVIDSLQYDIPQKITFSTNPLTFSF